MDIADFNPESYKAYLFDMDGVLTQTAKVHAMCWKKMFDEFLKEYAEKSGQPFQPFEIETDYINYVDGKPRYEGVKSFLKSRGISLPETSLQDEMSVQSLGDRKNSFIRKVLETEGVGIYEGTIEFVKYLRSRSIKTAVVSSSKNCRMILEAAGITDLFETRVDGEVALELGLAGKPAPDMFLTAAKNLEVSADNAVVVEDAISGVQAGSRGKFALVIGINHEGDFVTLKKNGADFVVSDLGEFIS